MNILRLLFPEIVIVFSMGLVFFYQVILALLLLLAGMLIMAITVVVFNAYLLWNYDAVGRGIILEGTHRR